MNKTYFNTQARTLFALISLFILVSSCEENFPVETDDTDTLSVSPSIDSVRAVYNDITQRFFLEALLSDPQGLSNILSVTFIAFKAGQSDSLFGALNDSGLSGDIIRGDGRYSALLSPSLTDSGLGSFRFTISAIDSESNAAEVSELLLDITNYPPQLAPFSVTDSVLIGNNIFIEVAVTDSNGLSDIRKVTYDVFNHNDSTLKQDVTFVMSDDGLLGDKNPGDGIYSVTHPTDATNEGGKAGVIDFLITAEDFTGLVSDTIIVKVTLLDFTNYPPQLTLFSVTDTVTVGDNIFIEVAVTDSNGLSDIRKVTYDIFNNNDSTLIRDVTFVMRDDGLFGDKNPGDGIYSVTQPTDPTGDTGVFDFLITAEDFAGLKSNTLSVTVTLTN